MVFITNSTEETKEVGRNFAKMLEDDGARRYVALRGEMGVGKTAFVRGFAACFGIAGVKSPTYTVVNEYRGRARIYHFDMYRITDGDDLYSIGYDDIVESDGYSLGEWSENITDFLPEDTIFVKISRVSNDYLSTDADKRIIEIYQN